jgi:hypothetical protein
VLALVVAVAEEIPDFWPYLKITENAVRGLTFFDSLTNQKLTRLARNPLKHYARA